MKTGVVFDAEAVFAEEFDKALCKEVSKSPYPIEDWQWSGRSKPERSIEQWRERGPACVQAYIDWYENEPDASVWVTPDGRPAIELDLTVPFGSVQVKMGIDQVIQLGTALVVVDLKSSAKPPKSVRQLAIYASGIEKTYGIRPRYGAYFMNRGSAKGGEMVYFQRPVPLDSYQYSHAYLTAEFEAFEQARRAGIFLSNPGEACGRCAVARACSAVGGQDARRYDPSHPAFKR